MKYRKNIYKIHPKISIKNILVQRKKKKMYCNYIKNIMKIFKNSTLLPIVLEPCLYTTYI